MDGVGGFKDPDFRTRWCEVERMCKNSLCVEDWLEVVGEKSNPNDNSSGYCKNEKCILITLTISIRFAMFFGMSLLLVVYS